MYALAVIILLCSLGIVMGVLYSHFTQVQIQQLKNELSLAVTGTEQYGNAFLEEVDLLSIAQEVKGILEKSAAQKNVSIRISGAGFMVQGVRRMLQEIIYNLCDNAISKSFLSLRASISTGPQ